MHYNDLASLMDILTSESEEEEAQLKGLTSLLAKKSLINKLNPSVLFEWSDPAIINISYGRKNALSDVIKIASVENKQHRSKGLKKGEWLETKKRRVRNDRDVAKDEIAMHLTKRRHFFDTDWDELWNLPGN